MREKKERWREVWGVLLLGLTSSASTDYATQAESSLSTLYAQLEGENWKQNTNWLSGSPCTTSWYGISCSGSYVVELELGTNDLSGSLPSEIGLLTGVTSIDISDNDLSGALPSQCGMLSALTYADLYGGSLRP